MSERGHRVRPITIMAFIGVVALAAAGLFVWTRPDRSTGAPAALPILLGSSSGALPSAAADIALAPARTTTFVAASDLPPLGGSAPAWRLAGPSVDEAAVARLGHAFGLRGPVQAQDGGWTMGAQLMVTPAGAHAWSWSYDPTATVTSPPIACARPLAGAENIGADDTVAPITCGSAPAPPVGVPDQATAERQARAVLAAAGFDLAGWKVTTAAGPYSATVTAAPVLDGVDVEGLSTTVAFGAHGAVTYGAGWFGTPQRADSYPLVGTKVAISELQHGDDFGVEPVTGTTIAPDLGPADRSWTKGLVPPAAEGTTTTLLARGSTPGSVGDRLTPVPNPPATVAATTTPPPVTVTIDRAEMVLVARVGTDGSMWLVPAYRLSTSGGGTWTVLAVDRKDIGPQPAIKSPGPRATIEPPSGAGGDSPNAGTGRSGVPGG